MINSINFTKMVASGNDFVVIDNVAGNYQMPSSKWVELARKICDRKYGAGADGLLLLENTVKADLRMRIFNPDGSEADMCGNGARCCAKYFSCQLSAISHQLIEIETRSGILKAYVNGNMVKLHMVGPRSTKLNFQLVVNNLELVANYINTGVPHTVIFTEDLEGIDVATLGSKIRYHKEFQPHGTNVDFLKVLDKNNIAVRTYERGVEVETLACGTGCVASAIIYASQANVKSNIVNVSTRSGEVLKVSFDKKNNKINNIMLEGSAKITYEGSLVTAWDSR
jgi:diaminopimelate epimerase